MENLLTKRNIIIAGVGIVILIGILFYFGSKSGTQGTGGGGFLGTIFPSSAPSPTLGVGGPQTPSVLPGGELPLTPQAAQSLPVGTLIRLSDDNISSLVGVGTTSVRYHKNIPENLGHLFERRADGASEEKRISNFTIPQVLRVVWAPDAKRAVIFYNLDNQIRKLLIDYSTTTPKTNFLPDAVSDVAFSPDSKSLAFINDSGDTQNIFTATSDFKNQRKILDNDIPGLEISWPAANTIALKTKSSYAVRGFLYAVNIGSGAFSKIAEGLGLDAIWNKDGSGVLYSRSDADGNILNIKFLDIKTGAEKEFSVKTIAEKCAFLNTLKNIAYCGVPRLSAGRITEKQPDAWWQGKVSFQDNFVSLDTATGQNSVFVPTPTDITQPKLLLDDSSLLFRDKTSGNLWSLKLKP
ncbi:MAG: hypothetical protein Q8Q46_02120 [Candidatus Giovannonibacteria bacterium]|nr:hypothetical protein [Candidatus Giovannonibacteria bacterium]